MCHSTFWGHGECTILRVAKTALRQKLLAELKRRPQHTSKKLQKLTHPAHRSPPIPMALLNLMPSPFGGCPRSSWVTSHYPSLTLLSKRTTQYSLFLAKLPSPPPSLQIYSAVGGEGAHLHEGARHRRSAECHAPPWFCEE